MQLNRLLFIIFLIFIVLTTLFFSPLLTQIVLWQRELNSLLSSTLKQIGQHQIQSGLLLILISFLYGIFHALGPGHGKFIISGYLATHETKLTESIKLTFLSSLAQGLVAVLSVSFIVQVFKLSSAYFKLSQLWLERGAFILLFCLGIQWAYQAAKKYVFLRYQQKPRIKKIQIPAPPLQSAVKNSSFFTQSSMHCGCHALPTPAQLDFHSNGQSRLLIILTIGLRPCSGAVFVLFLAYMLNLYRWGVIATFTMALGTGLTLTAVGLLVRYARLKAIRLGNIYRFIGQRQDYINIIIKLTVACLLIFTAVGLLYNTTLPSTGGLFFSRTE